MIQQSKDDFYLNVLKLRAGHCIFRLKNILAQKFKACTALRCAQVFRHNLKPRLDKFSLYCFQIGIDHSFFYHSSSAIAIFHTTFQELFNRVIYFRLLKQKYAAIRAQTWTIEKKPSIFLVLTEYLSCLPTDLDKTNAIESEIECRLQIYHISKYRHLS